MLPHRPARLLSGFGLRLGLGLGLLLGSAGLALATTLLLFLATHDGAAAHVKWKAATETDPHGFNLSRKAPTNSTFQPLATLASTDQLSYSFADTYLYQSHSGLLPGPVVYRLTPRGPDPNPTPTGTETDSTSAVQRSWDTIKLMFR